MIDYWHSSSSSSSCKQPQSRRNSSVLQVAALTVASALLYCDGFQHSLAWLPGEFSLRRNSMWSRRTLSRTSSNRQIIACRADGVKWNTGQNLQFENDQSSKWDPQNRQQTRSYEDAENILKQTGRLPRVLRLCDAQLGRPPLRKTIVADAKERRKAAEMVSIYDVSKLQAKLLIRREFHPVWSYERVLVYGNMLAEYLVPCANSNEPMEVTTPLKFKAAFRENYDPNFPTRETQWNQELEKRGLRPDITEGKVFEKLLEGTDPFLEVPDNMFCEAILDNVVDLGEVVLQFFACHVDRFAVSSDGKKNKLSKRMTKRMSKELGINATFDIKDESRVYPDSEPSAQELHDALGGSPEWGKYKFPKYRKIQL